MGHIKKLEIENFKSIKKLKIDCSRINLFIGKPNVGKTNILEALSLLGTPGQRTFFGDYIFYNELSNLFYDQDVFKTIRINTDISQSVLKFFKGSQDFCLLSNSLGVSVNEEYFENIKNSKVAFDSYPEFLKKKSKTVSDTLNYYRAIVKNKNSFSPIPEKKYTGITKYYKFKRLIPSKGSDEIFTLDTPDGKNVFKIISTHTEIKKELSSYFQDYGLELVYNSHEQLYSIQKKVDGVVYPLPYELTADTLQRIVFYSAAIYSNEDTALIFEEPEVHSFPTYIEELGHKICDSKSNQFFITTHNPYLLLTILENSPDDVSLFIIDYHKHQTRAQKLSKEDIRELLNYGTDIFLNLEDFIRDEG